MTTVGILLAAGRSSRFGAANKLLADLNGAPLVSHAAKALLAAGFDQTIAITSTPETLPALCGMDHILNETSDAAQSDNLRLGLTYAQKQDADRVVVVLGDMPFVPTTTIQQVASLSDAACAAASFGPKRLPPVGIPAALFEAAKEITGDKGARDLIKHLPREQLIEISADEARDIDTEQQLSDVIQSLQL